MPTPYAPSFVPSSRRSVSVPPRIQGINKHSPIFSGLLGAYPMRYDFYPLYGSSEPLIVTDGTIPVAIEPTRGGPAVNWGPETNGGGATVPLEFSKRINWSQGSMSIMAKLQASVIAQIFLIHLRNDNSNRIKLIFDGNENPNYAYVGQGNNYGVLAASTEWDFQFGGVGRWAQFIITWDIPNSTIALYCGSLVEEAGGAITGAHYVEKHTSASVVATGDATDFFLGTNNITSGTLDGHMADLFIWEKPLSEPEAFYFLENPFTLYEDTEPRYWAPKFVPEPEVVMPATYHKRAGSEPPDNVVLNPYSPQADGLIGWWPMHGDRGGHYSKNLVGGAPFDRGEKPSTGTTDLTEVTFDPNRGHSLLFNNETELRQSVGIRNDDLPPTFPCKTGGSGVDFTAMCWFRPYADDARNRHPLMLKQGNQWGGTGGTGRGWMLAISSAFYPQCEVWKNNGSDTTGFSGVTKPTVGKWNFFAMSYKYITDGTSLLNLYMGDKLENNATDAVGPLWDQSTYDIPFTLSRYQFTTGYSAHAYGAMSDVRVYDKWLEPSEIRQCYYEPWDLYATQPNLEYVTSQLWAVPG